MGQHPQLALPEVAERHADTEKQIDPHTVMNFMAYLACYLMAASQKASFQKASFQEASKSTVNLAIKKQAPTASSFQSDLQAPFFKRGAMSSATYTFA